MAEERLLVERIISGRGTLRVPSNARKLRYLRLFIDVIREPRNLYGNFDWNPAQFLYSRIAYRRDRYVQSFELQRYRRESRTVVLDDSGQTLLAIKCAYAGILQSFVNLIGGISGTPGGIGIFVTSVENRITDFKPLQLSWDEVLFFCYADTALQVRLFGCDYDQCPEEDTENDNPPPPPPPRTPVPPGTPITDISDPYDDEDSDDTAPFSGDTRPENPDLPGELCTAYELTIRVFAEGAFVQPTPDFRDFVTALYGPVEIEVRQSAEVNAVITLSRGAYPGTGCSSTTVENLIINLPGFVIDNVEVISFEEII